ncbi:hypothetical protein CLV58_1017 [Spirosoma oryzae]|uniref:DUF4175 domain-containing protein n=1 Tax=Spirosoma oryzae TaxID=1469603 RepID=A0A2T0TMR2_9BACT|nr:hypothetical protein [Spirosoma oryzae]PRY46943.1 hypothetical protein CLV58_1017 [Spirosoma oryzae]
MNELKRLIASVTYQLYANALLGSLMLAAAGYLLVATFVPSPLTWPLLAGLASFALGVYLNKLHQDKKQEAIRLIHQTIGDAEYSLPLLTKPQLNLAEELQLDRLNQQVQQVRTPVVLWANIAPYGLVLLGGLAVYTLYPLLNQSSQPNQSQRTTAVLTDSTRQAAAVPTLVSAHLQIHPPAYTRLPDTRSTNLNASGVTGSLLTWTIRFSESTPGESTPGESTPGTPQRLTLRLVSSQGQEVPFRLTNGQFTYQDRLINSGLYAIKAYWQADNKRDSVIYQSDFYRLDARPDLAPKIETTSKELYKYHYLNDPKLLTVAARVSDDFSVSQAFLVATIARGSGENVKFREVKMPLTPTNFHDARLTKTLDLRALQFAPGDELYYYWSAFDNRQPEPNFTKSDTYFLVYKDTAKVDDSELATMAMNVMPDYFRSQRQIIIDTEKLIAGRKKLPPKAFNSQSNEIGFDQKALRLRYGQFLGEEFEKNIGGDGSPPIPTNKDGVVVAGMAAIQAQMHKQNGGEGGSAQPANPTAHSADDGHNHGGGGSSDGSQDPLAALIAQYTHNHDDAETNTFHEQSTRSLLKMALENMWESELQLRLYEPEKALPYEQEALKYLKMSQQKARSFVRKTGFTPPETKEKETRLTGELKNVTNAFTQERQYSQQQISTLAAGVLGSLDQPSLSASQRQQARQLGNTLANRAINSSLANWSVLAILQKLVGNKPLTDAEKISLKTKLYALTGASERTGPSYASDRALRQAFWRHAR